MAGWKSLGEGLPWYALMQAPPTGYSAGCVVRKKLVYLEELRRRGPDFGECLQIPQTWTAR
jgi:hypothetical protein